MVYFFLSFTNIVTGRVFCLQHGCCICCTWDFHEHVTTVEYNKANKVARQIIFFTSGLLNLFMEKYIDRNIVSPVFLLLVTICDTIWVFFFWLICKKINLRFPYREVNQLSKLPRNQKPTKVALILEASPGYWPASGWRWCITLVHVSWFKPYFFHD